MGHAEKQRTVDFAAEDEDSLLVWLLGLQQIIAFWANPKVPESEQWTMPKLHLQKLRLKVSGESDKTGQGPYDVVLAAVLEVAAGEREGDEKGRVVVELRSSPMKTPCSPMKTDSGLKTPAAIEF